MRVVGKDFGLKQQLLYASECLSDKVIAIANQDNKCGKVGITQNITVCLEEITILFFVVFFAYFILSRLLYLAFSANLGLLCMPHPGMGPLV